MQIPVDTAYEDLTDDQRYYLDARQWLKDARRRRGLKPIDGEVKPYRWMPWDVFAVMHPEEARSYEARMARAAEYGDVVWSSEETG